MHILPEYDPTNIILLHCGPNKKFLETDYPRGRAVEVFHRTDSYRYHFGLRAKTEILYFAPPGIAKKQFRPPPRGGMIGNPEAEPSGNYKD
jgi:hypothetical protein